MDDSRLPGVSLDSGILGGTVRLATKAVLVTEVFYEKPIKSVERAKRKSGPCCWGEDVLPAFATRRAAIASTITWLEEARRHSPHLRPLCGRTH